MELSTHSLFGTYSKNRFLYPHQVSVLQWAKIIEYNISNPVIFKGGIFADEMGMGKTLVACMLIATTPVPLTLVMCPPLIRFVWVEEILKSVSDEVNVYTINEGTILKCKLVVNENGVEERVDRKIKPERGETIMEPAVVVCNYQLITAGTRNNSLLKQKLWNRIIIDEAHILRNENKSWKKISELKSATITTNGVNHRYCSRWCITGTPIQMEGNRNLINIFKYIDDRFLTSINPRIINDELIDLIKSNLFRRNKYQLTSYMKRYMRFPETDPIFYKERITLEETSLSRIVKTLDFPGLINLCKNRDGSFNVYKIREILSDEKSFLISKILEYKFLNHGIENQKFYESQNFREFMSYPYNKIPNFILRINPGVNVYNGKMSKINKFKEIINRFRGQPNNSFVVFHHFKFIATELKRTVENEYPEYFLLEINGDKSDEERDNIRILANRYIEEGKTVILLSSIKATYEGINYQSFDKIIFIESEYNVKVEEQARSRVQRIGQKNQVLIFEIIINDFTISQNQTIAIDSRIQEIRDEKINLSDIIDKFNAAFTFKRIYFRDDEGNITSGINFGEEFESLLRGSIGGPDSFGPDLSIEEI